MQSRTKRFIAGAVIAVAVTGISLEEPVDARRPIVWSVGEYQRGGFDAVAGDTVNVFMGTRDTEANVAKCDDMGGGGLILRRWRNRIWEVCTGVDF